MNEEKIEKIEIDLFLEAIYQKYGFDFRNYAYSSIRRRILYRVQANNLETISQLQGKVLYDAVLMKLLLSDFSITVTEMFRDPSFFNAFRLKVVPSLKQLPKIRIWIAGCSSGEEVYSIAILLHEEGLLDKTKIYATDFNEDIIEKAKRGEMPINKMKLYTKNYQSYGGTKEFSEYYMANNETAIFEPFLKKNIIFAQHNLATDYSFNEFHVIICRNVLIYFNRQLKERVLNLFYNSLCETSFLGLGSKETLLCEYSSKLFQEIDNMNNLYRKNNLNFRGEHYDKQ